jgi:hypothetical protein
MLVAVVVQKLQSLVTHGRLGMVLQEVELLPHIHIQVLAAILFLLQLQMLIVIKQLLRELSILLKKILNPLLSLLPVTNLLTALEQLVLMQTHLLMVMESLKATRGSSGMDKLAQEKQPLIHTCYLGFIRFNYW